MGALLLQSDGRASHPVRGAWIEIRRHRRSRRLFPSHPVRGAWIEILILLIRSLINLSHPVRGAWIEIDMVYKTLYRADGRTPSGVRGLKLKQEKPAVVVRRSHPVRGAWIEMDPLLCLL